ncbi:MAG TPA: NUDIX domain-containing protein [Candidatus Dojkabacteria bacterium]|jgi:mutator protein MutT|nr:NUDIX domain-containing protein [Candidatus Dojkabacteria bacterium]
MERLKVKVAVYMILLNKDGRVLFGRRSNTGWQDGKLSLPSGHVDPGELPTESAIRELEEEVDIAIKPEQIQIKHIAYRKDNYIDFYFLVRDWAGNPIIMEPSKCSELVWVDINITKDEFAPNVLLATKKALNGQGIFSEFTE